MNATRTVHPDSTHPTPVRPETPANVGTVRKPKPTHDGPQTNESCTAVTDRSLGEQRACAPVRPRTIATTRSNGEVGAEERQRLAAGFGADLRKMRKANKLTQEKLGDLAGLRGDSLGRLERGQRRPTVDVIKSLVRVLVSKDEREAVEQALAASAGESLREGNERKKRAKENKHRKVALAKMEETARKARRQIAMLEARGLPVSPILRRATDTAVIDRLRADLAPVPEDDGISGHRGQDAPKQAFRKLPRTQKGFAEFLNEYADPHESVG